MQNPLLRPVGDSRKNSLMTQPRRILVADDVHDTADTTAALLSFGGYEVRAVYDGLQAVEAARTFAPDMVILDINMPVMGGYEAARRLRAEQAPGSVLVLVALTGRTTRDDVALGVAAGFDHHLGKPLVADVCALAESFFAAADAGARSRALPAAGADR